MMRRTMIAAAFSAMALAACGSVSDSVTFHAPPGFVSKAALGPFMEVWESVDNRSALMVMQIPGEVDINKAMSSANVKSAKVVKKQQITICGSQPAVFAELTGTTGSNIKIGIGDGSTKTENSNIDFIVTHANGSSYFGMYAWPIHDAPDPAAQSAIRALCAKK
ncbi:MAG: hypothetical protein M3M96_00295 [Candidatus Eremiobacteraeota bacterium]|nr:hypothetical protein [Candidatus Eremiobacteraeota bacterium]